MARIRTIKPEFFKNHKLFKAEQEEGLPLRVAFAGLWTVCDREGRFKWRPEELKLECLPFDDVDFSRVLDALWSRGYLEKYAINSPSPSDENNDDLDEFYGYVPSWNDHQVPNNKESKSVLHSPEESVVCTRPPRGKHASATPLFLTQGEREGKGKEGERKGKEKKIPVGRSPDLPTPIDPKPIGTELVTLQTNPSEQSIYQVKCRRAWDAYAVAYQKRYGTSPVRNAKTNSLIKQLVTRLGDEAQYVVEFYVEHASSWYMKRAHCLEAAVGDAEKLHMEWVTNRRITNASAINADRKQAAGAALGEYLAKLEVAQ